MQPILTKLLNREDLGREEMTAVMTDLMEGRATPAQTAAFLVAMRMKGETVAELAAAAQVMRRHAVFIHTGGAGAVVDTCGTGGDGLSTFNISTAAAFVAAGAGVCVAKHGNRAVSSRCGSADVLAELGLNLEAPAAAIEQCIQEHGIGFLFAQKMHPAMKHVAPIRKELGVRTIFNMLGPLANPAGATGQVLGVFKAELTETFARVLRDLGTRRALVVHGLDGLDEITITDRTRVCELRNGELRTYELDAALIFGDYCNPAELAGGDAATNARILRAVLDGSEQGAPRQVTLLNAAAAIVVGEKADRIEDALRLAEQSIASGAALGKLQTLIAATQ
ncbi:MAG: anthranilate phosphoribosyltransferase [Lentisphaeria bacterium]|jgi:anthranilate phosphoribosyltransferase